MKRSLRFPFTLLLLIAACTALSCRAVLRRGLAGGSPPETATTAAAVAVPSLNTTLLRLAAAEAGEADLRRDVEELLDGTFPAGYDRLPSGRRRFSASWRRENHHLEGRTRAAMGYPARLRSPKDYRVLPEFRRHLRDWFRRRRFHPGIMAELLGQVKRPLDLHAGAPGPPGRRRYASCAVVGNSGILLSSERGALIDGHELVIRLNNARVRGYERNVGSKTNVSFVNSNILHLCARRGSCLCHPYGEGVPLVMYICQAAHFLDYTACNASHKAPLLVTDARFDLLCARIVKYYSLRRFVEETGKPPAEWAKAHDERMFHYSSGMQAVMLAVGICDQVSAFGFGKVAGAKHHYHTNQKAELDLHDYEAEYAFYRDLVERPQVIPFLGDSGFKVPPVVLYL